MRVANQVALDLLRQHLANPVKGRVFGYGYIVKHPIFLSNTPSVDQASASQVTARPSPLGQS